MNEFEIVGSLDHQLENVENINVKQGIIEFPQYEELIEKAQQVASYLDTLDVNEDTIKESKKIIAQAKKITRELSDRRITIKRYMLEPYNDFEIKIKEISSIIDNADDKVRTQINEFEEKERIEKQHALKDIFNERVVDYQISKLDDSAFGRWLTPQMMNKSTTFKQAESNMVEWLEKVEKDINAINKMEDSTSIMSEYLSSYDLANAISEYNYKKSLKERIKAVQTEDEEIVSTCTFIVTGDKDIALTKELLKNNKINYKEII